MGAVNTFKGIYFVLGCFLSSWLGSCFIMLPSLPLAVLAPHIYRSYVQFMMGIWLLFPPALYELLFGVKIRVCGDKMNRSERCLVIANHRTRLDWMFMWSLMGRVRWAALEKIILRGDLKHIPGFGWAMQIGGFYFLSRKWAKDEVYMTRKISYMMNSPEPYKLLIFPEGTDFEPKTKAKSDSYGERQGWPHLEYLLHPRSTGFIHCVKETNKGDIHAVYDITLGYPITLPQRGELDLVTGAFPEEIHMKIKRYDFKDIPLEKDDIDAWLRNVWYEKEKTLKKFYANGKFEEEKADSPYFSSNHNNFLVPIFLLWNSGLLLSIYLCIVSPVTRSYFLFANIVLFLLSSAGILEDLDRRYPRAVVAS